MDTQKLSVGKNCPAAGFKLIPDENVANRYNIPLKVVLGFAMDTQPQTYCVNAEGNGLKLVSQPFTVGGQGDQELAYVDDISPFFIDNLTAQCSFYVWIDSLTVYHVESGAEIASETDFGCPVMYFFLGSPALQLDGTNRQDVHVFELV